MFPQLSLLLFNTVCAGIVRKKLSANSEKTTSLLMEVLIDLPNGTSMKIEPHIVMLR